MKENDVRIQVKENQKEKIFLEQLAKSIASSDEFNRVVCALAPFLVQRWAGRNVFKKAVARAVAKSIQKSFSEKRKSAIEEKYISEVEFARAALVELPELVNGILGAMMPVVKNFSGFSDEEKEKIVSLFFESIEFSKVAEFLNELLKTASSMHQSNPHFFADTFAPIVASFIENVDFGELKELVENLSDDAELLTRRINEKLWEYPAKVICMLSLIPSVANILIRVATETIIPINRLAPDLLTDVVFSLVKEVDVRRVGMLVNQLSELVRKIHTGSALLGEPGKPQIPRVAHRLMEDFLSAVDSASVLKAMDLFDEIRNMIAMSFVDAAEKHPKLVQGMHQRKFRSISSNLRLYARQLDLLESRIDCEKMGLLFVQGIGEIDPQEIASIINRVCMLVNKAKEAEPGIVRDFISQIIASVDYREMGQTLRGLIEDGIEALRPVAGEIMPPLVRGFAELLLQEDGSGEMDDAVNKLRKVLMGKEVAR